MDEEFGKHNIIVYLISGFIMYIIYHIIIGCFNVESISIGFYVYICYARVGHILVCIRRRH